MHAPNHLVSDLAVTLLQGVQHWPDTVVTKQVVTEPGTFGKIGAIARLIMALSVMVLAMALVLAAWNFRRAYHRVTALLDRAYGDLLPLIRNAGVVSEDVRDMVSSVKGDVRQVQQTVAAANSRLLKAVRQAEERIDDFNAFMEVVQDEAESAFVSTAATVRGVRRGVEQALDHNAGEDDDGDNGDGGAPHAGAEQPRVRTRGAGQARGTAGS